MVLLIGKSDIAYLDEPFKYVCEKVLEYYILSDDWQILNHWKGLQRQDSQYRKPALIKDNSQAIFERIL